MAKGGFPFKAKGGKGKPFGGGKTPAAPVTEPPPPFMKKGGKVK